MTAPVKQQALSKQAAIERWQALQDNMPIEIEPISTQHKGSTFDQDVIRITGSQTFIDSVLSNLKGLLGYENESSRVEILYTQTARTERNRETGEIRVVGLSGSWGCYVKVKDRGRGQGKRGKAKPREEAPEPAKDLKAVNAGLEIREKMRTKAKSVGSKNEPMYAIGTPDDEEECGYAWTEPEDSDMPMSTYEDVSSAIVALEKMKKTAAFKKADLRVVEVWKTGGKLHCR